MGGEEFIVVLRDMDPDDARLMAERIRARVLALEPLGGPADVRVTCSLGVALSADAGLVQDLMRLADEALYDAKRLGRNRIEVREAGA